MLKRKKIHKRDLPKLKKYYRVQRRQAKTVFSLGSFIMLLSFVAISWTTYNLLSWDVDNKSTQKVNEYIASIINTNNSNIQVENDLLDCKGEEKISLDTPKQIDFQRLRSINSDTVGYLTVKGTTISYPIVQTLDNEFYLNHSFDKRENAMGWIYLDYRNSLTKLNDNSIIYGHGGSDKALFGTLKNVLTKNWVNDTSNHFINLKILNEEMVWEVFSVYKIPTETYYLTSSFGTKESHQEFINTVKNRSLYDFAVDVSIDDKILTLSTCYNNAEKVVLHAKLIERR